MKPRCALYRADEAVTSGFWRRKGHLGIFVPGDLCYLSPCEMHLMIGKQIKNRERREMKVKGRLEQRNMKGSMKNGEELGVNC